jgi:NADPH:quinone reductase-like Zn-dependent oxidoreductase
VSLTTNKKVIAGVASGTTEGLAFLASLVEAGAFTPVIDRRYPFDRIAEAHAYVNQGHKRGNLVVQIHPDAVA